MPDPTPIRPRRLDETEYQRRLRASVLQPIIDRLRARIADAATYAQLLRDLNEVLLNVDPGDLGGPQAQAMARRLAAYHRQRTIDSMRAALGIDIRPVLREAAIQDWMMMWRANNVALIRTIPPRLHDALLRRFAASFAEAPFDRSALAGILREEFGSSGYNLRRIARDQVSKGIGNLTQIRHQQLGIRQYHWRTSEDERVRPTHAALNGTLQDWGSPPPGTGHPGQDIQCRCTAQAVIPAGFARQF